MKCPYCECLEHKVIDSRPAEEGNSIRRRRECDKCNKRFTTFEKLEIIPVMVVKNDKRREPFSREKILNGLIKACQKRPVSLDCMETIISEVESEIENSLLREVRSKEIGELVMNKLKEIDDVAYVRFASVTRKFKDINTFMDELYKLLEEKK